MILVPTLNRLKLLDRFTKSVIETKSECPGLILVDKKDWNEHEKEYCAISMPAGWKYVVTDGVSMGDKVRESHGHWKDSKWVGLLNDDHVCITPGWDKILEEILDGTNMVSSNDGFWNFGYRVCGITAFSMPLLNTCGFHIFPRRLQHLYIDDIWKAIGESSGCWNETMRIDFPHKHVFKGEMEKDATFEKVNAPSSWEFDAKEFKEFMEQDFKNVVEKIMNLRSKANQDEKFC